MKTRRKALNSAEILALLDEGYEIHARQSIASDGTSIGLSQQWMQKPRHKKPADAPTVHWSSYLALRERGEITALKPIQGEYSNICRWGLKR